MSRKIERFENEGKINGYLKAHFRRAWRYYSKPRKECVKLGICADCGERGKDLVADHIDPVVNPLWGFEGWDVYYERMFFGKLQPLCKKCHTKKTNAEKKVRAKARAERKAQ